MPIANFPANLSAAIQQGYLQKRWEDALVARLGYRDLAMKEMYDNNIGETITRTRGGLLQAVTTPLDPSTNTNLDNGLTPQYWSVEQYVMALEEYADTMDLNIVNQKVGIADQFLKNASTLAEQAKRSLDIINRNILFGADISNQLNGAYMGGNTRVTATLGAPADTIAVDDIRGFYYTIPTSGANSGRPNIPTSSSNTQPVQVNLNIYTLESVTIDVVNVSTAFGGVSGTLTFSSNVTVADGTAGNAVISGYGSFIVRPNDRLTTNDLIVTDVLTLDTCRTAVLQLENNAIPGPYTLVIPPVNWMQLYRDTEFQLLFRGTEFNSPEYKNLKPSGETLGFDIMIVNVPPTQTLNGLNINRPILCGQECLIEADFEGSRAVLEAKYGTDSEIHDIEEAAGVYHVTRAPLDRLQQIVAQSWFYIGGFTAPTDQTANASTIPTASSAYYKRAVMIETA